MSRSSLHRKIVDQAGCSPGELIRQIRMQLGKQLLLAGSDNVSEVAYSVGYSSLSSFSRAYRQYYGIAPSAEYLPATRMRPATVGQATATGWKSLDLRL
jgi:AraC-like DNA-binding protein